MCVCVCGCLSSTDVYYINERKAIILINSQNHLTNVIIIHSIAGQGTFKAVISNCFDAAFPVLWVKVPYSLNHSEFA